MREPEVPGGQAEQQGAAVGVCAVQQAIRRVLTSRRRLEAALPATWQRRLAAALGGV